MRKEWYGVSCERSVLSLCPPPLFTMLVDRRLDSLRADTDLTMTPEGLRDVGEVMGRMLVSPE